MLLPRHNPSLSNLAESLRPEVLRDNRQSWLPSLPSWGVRTGLLRSWGGTMVTQTVEIPRGACEKWEESEGEWESVFSQGVELSSRSAGHKIQPFTTEAFSCPPRGKRSAFFLEKKILTFSFTQTDEQQFNHDSCSPSPRTSAAQGRILIFIFLKNKLAKISTVVMGSILFALVF